MDKQTIDGMSIEHRLKIHKTPYLDLLSGAKTCEVRDCSDRDFKIGDSVVLMLVDETGNPTTNKLRRKITHVQTGYGLPDEICVLSYEPAAQPQGEVERLRSCLRTEVVAGDSWKREAEDLRDQLAERDALLREVRPSCHPKHIAKIDAALSTSAEPKPRGEVDGNSHAPENQNESNVSGCCCPPKGFADAWAAGPCPIHQGLRTLKP